MKLFRISIRTVVILTLVSISLIGSDCNELIENSTQGCTGNRVDLVGSWKFTSYLGGVRDICIGERIEFTAAGVATLTCPNQAPITRNYTVTNNELKYTDTGVRYCIDGDVDELMLTGVNNDRILYYVKIITDYHSEKENHLTSDTKNSSELTK